MYRIPFKKNINSGVRVPNNKNIVFTFNNATMDNAAKVIHYNDVLKRLNSNSKWIVIENNIENDKTTVDAKILAKLDAVSDESITISYEEKQAVEGKKRKVLVNVERTFNFDEIKYTKEYLDFK